MDIAKTKRLSEDNVNALINSMFTSAGFENKESLNYDDFKTMMKEFKGKEIYISFNFLLWPFHYIVAINELICLKNVGAPVSLFFTSYE